MEDNWLAKIAKTKHLRASKNVGARVGHRHHGRTGTLDEIRDMVLQEGEEEEEKETLYFEDFEVHRQMQGTEM